MESDEIGDIKNKKNGLNNNWIQSEAVAREIPILSLQRFRDDCTEKVKRDIEDFFDSFISDVEQLTTAGQDENINLTITNKNRYLSFNTHILICSK